MATTFKIHEDDFTSLSEVQGNKFKETKTAGNGKRCVLAQIQNSFTSEVYKTINYATSKKDLLPREAAAVSTGFTENIKALGLKDKDRGNQQNISKIRNVRPPLTDLHHCPKGNDVRKSEKVESPMSVDSPPVIPGKCEPKETIKSLTETPTNRITLKDKNSAVGSPMSVDASPARLECENTRTSLDDLYGCYAYKQDIYKYLRKIEEEFRPKPYYMRRQPDVSYSMRTILVDWLVEVGEEYKLRNETLFMAVSYIDRFLSTMAVAKPKLQLLGTSAMLIAAKFEEIYPPEVGEFTYITDDSYTIRQVLRMERLILKVLSFDLSCPTSYTFIMHISSCVKLSSKVIYLAMYICELTLLEADPYLDFPPSLIASGAIALARRCLDYVDVWPSSLAQVTGYLLSQLAPVINHLNETHSRSFKLPQTAIRHKYRRAEYDAVSTVPFKKLVLRDSYVS